MGRKKYYCDYCEKAFNDDPIVRLKHLQGIKHQQAKKEHYRNFRDPKEILEEELKKESCIRFQRDGECRFGFSCRYSHYSPYELDTLRRIVESQKDESATVPNFLDWYSQRTKSASSQPMSHEVPIPPQSLPPSLRPFPIAEYVFNDLPQWRT